LPTEVHAITSSFGERARQGRAGEYHKADGEDAGAVAELVGIEGGVVSGVFNLESPGVRAPGRRPRHDEPYHEA
jgi:hypothetical protein